MSCVYLLFPLKSNNSWWRRKCSLTCLCDL